MVQRLAECSDKACSDHHSQQVPRATRTVATSRCPFSIPLSAPLTAPAIAFQQSTAYALTTFAIPQVRGPALAKLGFQPTAKGLKVLLLLLYYYYYYYSYSYY